MSRGRGGYNRQGYDNSNSWNHGNNRPPHPRMRGEDDYWEDAGYAVNTRAPQPPRYQPRMPPLYQQYYGRRRNAMARPYGRRPPPPPPPPPPGGGANRLENRGRGNRGRGMMLHHPPPPNPERPWAVQHHDHEQHNYGYPRPEGRNQHHPAPRQDQRRNGPPIRERPYYENNFDHDRRFEPPFDGYYERPAPVQDPRMQQFRPREKFYEERYHAPDYEQYYERNGGGYYYQEDNQYNDQYIDHHDDRHIEQYNAHEHDQNYDQNEDQYDDEDFDEDENQYEEYDEDQSEQQQSEPDEEAAIEDEFDTGSDGEPEQLPPQPSPAETPRVHGSLPSSSESVAPPASAEPTPVTPPRREESPPRLIRVGRQHAPSEQRDLQTRQQQQLTPLYINQRVPQTERGGPFDTSNREESAQERRTAAIDSDYQQRQPHGAVGYAWRNRQSVAESDRIWRNVFRQINDTPQTFQMRAARQTHGRPASTRPAVPAQAVNNNQAAVQLPAGPPRLRPEQAGPGFAAHRGRQNAAAQAAAELRTPTAASEQGAAVTNHSQTRSPSSSTLLDPTGEDRSEDEDES